MIIIYFYTNLYIFLYIFFEKIALIRYCFVKHIFIISFKKNCFALLNYQVSYNTTTPRHTQGGEKNRHSTRILWEGRGDVGVGLRARGRDACLPELLPGYQYP